MFRDKKVGEVAENVNWVTKYSLNRDGTGTVSFLKYLGRSKYHCASVHIDIEDLRDIKENIENLLPELEILIDTQKAVRE